MSFDPKWQREIGRGFERQRLFGFVEEHVNGFGPLRTVFGLEVRMNNTVDAIPHAVDFRAGLDGAHFANGFDDTWRHWREVVWIYFVNVITVSFPIFMQQQCKVYAR